MFHAVACQVAFPVCIERTAELASRLVGYTQVKHSAYIAFRDSAFNLLKTGRFLGLGCGYLAFTDLFASDRREVIHSVS